MSSDERELFTIVVGDGDQVAARIVRPEWWPDGPLLVGRNVPHEGVGLAVRFAAGCALWVLQRALADWQARQEALDDLDARLVRDDLDDITRAQLRQQRALVEANRPRRWDDAAIKAQLDAERLARDEAPTTHDDQGDV